MDYSFQNPQELKIDADLRSRWRRLQNTWGFCDQLLAEAVRLRVQVSIHAWPNWLGIEADEFPREATATYRDSRFSYGVEKQTLTLKIVVPNIRNEILPRSGRPGFYFRPERIWGPGRLGYWLSVLAYFYDDVREAYPDIREFDTEFYQGGLPGLGRR